MYIRQNDPLVALITVNTHVWGFWKKKKYPTGFGLRGECLPGACPAHARRATFVFSILAPAPNLSSPREVPQVDRTGPQTFRARHLV